MVINIMCTNESTKNNFLECDCHYCLSLRKRAEKVFNKTKFRKGEYVLHDGEIHQIKKVKIENLKSCYNLYENQQLWFVDEDLKSTNYINIDLNKTKVLYKNYSKDYWIVTDKKIENNNVILTIMSSVDNDISIQVDETDVKILSSQHVEDLEKFFKNNYKLCDDLFVFKKNFLRRFSGPIYNFKIIGNPSLNFPYVFLRETTSTVYFYVEIKEFLEVYELLDEKTQIKYNKYLRKLNYFNWIYNMFYKIF